VRDFQFFVFARLYQGVCTGLLSSIAPMMMKELSPTEISGTLTSCHQIFITFGATFGFIFSMMLSFILNDHTG
jgi:MFS family permease